MNMNSKPIPYYPAFFNLEGKKCVVVGGGEVGLRKVKMLVGSGAHVTVITPEPHTEITKLWEERAIHLFRREYRAGDLDGAAMAIAATDGVETNRKVAEEARRANVPVNVADDPERSDFIVPSYFRRGDLTVAVSTAGVSPAFAKKIRTKLEGILGEEYAILLSIIGEVRADVKKKYPASAEAWQRSLDLDLLARLVKKGQQEEAKDLLLAQLICEPETTKI